MQADFMGYLAFIVPKLFPEKLDRVQGLLLCCVDSVVFTTEPTLPSKRRPFIMRGFFVGQEARDTNGSCAATKAATAASAVHFSAWSEFLPDPGSSGGPPDSGPAR